MIKLKWVELAKQKFAGYYDYSEVSLSSYGYEANVICPKHGRFRTSLFWHAYYGIRCKKCAIETSAKSFGEFVTEASEKHNGFYNYDKACADYNKTVSLVTITCPLHGDFRQKASSHLEGVGCPKCARDRAAKGRAAFISEAQRRHAGKYDYSKVVYEQNKKKVEVICPTHGSFFVKPNAHLSSLAGCPLCSNKSKGEDLISRFLTEWGIEFVRQFRFDGSLYRYDFLIPSLKLLIEFNGRQHYKPSQKFGGDKDFKETVSRDKAKKELAIKNGYSLEILAYPHLFNQTLKRELLWCLRKRKPLWVYYNKKAHGYDTWSEFLRKENLLETALSIGAENSCLQKYPDFKVLFFL